MTRPTVVREFPVLRTRRRLADEDARAVASSTAALLRMLADLSDAERVLLWDFLSAARRAFIAEGQPALADALNALGQAAVTAAARPDGALRVAETLRDLPA